MGVVVREKLQGSGEWWVYTYYKGHRTAKKLGSKTLANQYAKIMREQLALGSVPRKSDIPTLEEYYRRFQRTYLASAVKETTRRSYELSFRVHILPELGRLRLNEIDRARVEAFVAHLARKPLRQAERKVANADGKAQLKPSSVLEERKTLSKHSIRLILAALGVVFRQAGDHGLVESNPTTRMGRFYRNAPVRMKEVQPLSAEEVQTFLQAVMNHPQARKYYALFLTAIHTGMRSGELAGLKWSDVDFNGQFIAVRRNYVDGRTTTTKTERIRRVDMSDSLIAALAELKSRLRKVWLTKGRNEIPEWVFCSSEGTPLDMRVIKRRYFKKVLQTAGLREIRFHDLRHTFATLLIQQGESLAYVKDQLGHSTIKMTVDTYTHWIPGSNRQAVNKLPALGSS